MIKKILFICLCVVGCIILAINANPKTAMAVEADCPSKHDCPKVPDSNPVRYWNTDEEALEGPVCCGEIKPPPAGKWGNEPSGY